MLKRVGGVRSSIKLFMRYLADRNTYGKCQFLLIYHWYGIVSHCNGLCNGNFNEISDL